MFASRAKSSAVGSTRPPGRVRIETCFDLASLVSFPQQHPAPGPGED